MKRIFLAIIVLSVIACTKAPNPVNPPGGGGQGQGDNGISSLSIPGTFDYSTSKTVQLNIADQSSGVIYDIYSIANTTEDRIIINGDDTTMVVDEMNHLIARGITVNNEFQTVLTIPSYHQNIHIVRNENGSFSSESLTASETINYTYTQLKQSNSGLKETAVTNTIYAVNSSQEFFKIDAVTGQVTQMVDLPYRSIACAVDDVNNRVYFANQKSPYQLAYYDIVDETFHTVGNLRGAFPRMDYNYDDGMLYISTNSGKIYKVDPQTALYLQSFNVSGLDNKGWGDLAFTTNGDMYMLTRTGVYAITMGSNSASAVKISPSDLPSPMTSATFDNNGKLWMSKSPSQSRVVLFDVINRTWEYKDISSNIRINDFGSLVDVTITDDDDGDGVPNNQDDYPNDPDIAFDNIYPGTESWASLAFEDLWPGLGDYDFNDLVLYYRFNQITNADNLVKKIKATFYVKHIGATLDNGFAFELPVSPNEISNVSGFNLTQGYMTLSGNNTEADQPRAVIPVFDYADENLGNTLEIIVDFVTGVSPTVLGSAPYNPFLIKDGQRGVEIHLPDMVPTQQANLAMLGTFHDNSNQGLGRYYKTQNNLPWAININYEFIHPLERQEIIKGYLRFAAWAESGGSQFPDWYKDEEGYRDETYLDN